MALPYSDRLNPRFEDELIDDAFVFRTAKKHYARRFNGDLERLPRFITKHLVDQDVRGNLSEIEVYCNGVDQRTSVFCHVGDWIVIDPNDNARVMSNKEFQEKFISVEDLNYNL